MPRSEAQSHSFGTPGCPEERKAGPPGASGTQECGDSTLGTHAPLLPARPICPHSPAHILTRGSQFRPPWWRQEKRQRKRQQDGQKELALALPGFDISRLERTETLTTFFSSHICTHLFRKHPGFWRLTLSTEIMAGSPLVTLGPRWHGLRCPPLKAVSHPPGSPLTGHNRVCLRARHVAAQLGVGGCR